MDMDDLPQDRSSPLDTLEKEDLDLYSHEELEDRIHRLKAEQARTEHALAGKTSHRSAAESLFGGTS